MFDRQKLRRTVIIKPSYLSPFNPHLQRFSNITYYKYTVKERELRMMKTKTKERV